MAPWAASAIAKKTDLERDDMLIASILFYDLLPMFILFLGASVRGMGRDVRYRYDDVLRENKNEIMRWC